MAEDALLRRARGILEGCSTMTIATTGPEGLWAADVYFAAQDLTELFFISSPSSRHASNALESAAAAATIHAETGSDWRAIRGLQMEGSVELVEDASIERARSTYVNKFPFAAALLRPDSEVAAKTSGTRFFRFVVRRLWLVDNSLGFGKRQELELSPTTHL